jgi:hypothetical protein
MKTLTMKDVTELNLLRPAIYSNNVLFIGTVHSMHHDVYFSADAVLPNSINGFVDSNDVFMTREEAALWLRRESFPVWKELRLRDALETVDYAEAAGIELKPGRCAIKRIKRFRATYAAPAVAECSCGFVYDVAEAKEVALMIGEACCPSCMKELKL